MSGIIEVVDGAVAEGSLALTGAVDRVDTKSNPCHAVAVQADSANVGKVAVGLTDKVEVSAGSQAGFRVLSAGQSCVVPINDSSVLRFKGTNGDHVSYSILRRLAGLTTPVRQS